VPTLGPRQTGAHAGDKGGRGVEPEIEMEQGMERIIERILLATRWLLLPLYFGLAVLLFLIAVHFFGELVHYAEKALAMTDKELILAVLSSIDIVLLGSLILMVMVSGYANFVARLDLDSGTPHLAWIGKLDAASLKSKVAASIMAISSIRLLQAFMDIEDFSESQVIWLVVIQFTFVLSALAFVLIDRIAGKH
jgi:uncharacterized protein (TIGR00645 family)